MPRLILVTVLVLAGVADLRGVRLERGVRLQPDLGLERGVRLPRPERSRRQPDLALQASTGATLRGRVDVRGSGPANVRRPAVADLVTAPARGEPVARPAVVYLESLDAARGSSLRSAAPLTGRARMDQRNETFVPHVLAVGVGTAVDFPNSDSTFHNVFSFSSPKRFDLGRYERGKSRTVRFDKPGVVRVFCDIHSHMSAFVLVFNHPFHSTADGDGRYQISGIPAGTYAVKAWHEGTDRGSQTVTVSPGATIDLDLLVW